MIAGKVLVSVAVAARALSGALVKRHAPPQLDAVALASSPWHGVAGWISNTPTANVGFDDAVFLAAMGDLMGTVAKHADRGRHNVEVRAALVKVMAAVAVAPDLDGTEGDIFAITEGIRREIYFEAMRFRRAAARDVENGAPCHV